MVTTRDDGNGAGRPPSPGSPEPMRMSDQYGGVQFDDEVSPALSCFSAIGCESNSVCLAPDGANAGDNGVKAAEQSACVGDTEAVQCAVA